MNCKVKVNKHQLDYFRYKARNSDLEIQAYLVGKIVSPEYVTVNRFFYPDKYAIQTSGEVGWYLEDFLKVQGYAEEHDLRVIGDIHSHPNWDAVLSPQDYKAHIKDGHRICGICSTQGRKTRVRFWIAESALPCQTIYE